MIKTDPVFPKTINLPQFGMSALIKSDKQIEIFDVQNHINEPVVTLELGDVQAIVNAFAPTYCCERAKQSLGFNHNESCKNWSYEV